MSDEVTQPKKDPKHWKLDRGQLQRAIAVAEKIPSSQGSFTFLRYDGDHLELTATNKDYYVFTKLKLLNPPEEIDDSIQDAIFFDLKTLSFLVNTYDDFILVYAGGMLYLKGPTFFVKIDTRRHNASTVMAHQGDAQYQAFLPDYSLELMNLLFTQTQDIMDNKILINKDELWCNFREYQARAKIMPEVVQGQEPISPSFGRFNLRKTDLPILTALRRSGGDKIRFWIEEAAISKLWATSGDITICFQLLPVVDRKEAPKPPQTQPEVLTLDRNLIFDAIKTLTFFGVHQANFTAGQQGTTKIDSVHASFLIGRGLTKSFSISVARLSSFLRFLPVDESLNIFKVEGSLVFQYLFKGLAVSLSLATESSGREEVSRKAPNLGPKKSQLDGVQEGTELAAALGTGS